MEHWNKTFLRAAQDGNIQDVDVCLQKRVDIDYKDVFGMTALMWAAKHGHLKVTRLLIDRGCNKYATDDDGITALHFAAEWGHLQVTMYLVEQAGISPRVESHEGETPYTLAAGRPWGKNREVMEYLESVMSKVAPDVSPKTFGKIQPISKVEGSSN